jgi:hypothetical protein
LTDFSTYLPPGIYIEEQPTTLVATPTVVPSVVALVGPSVGYQSHTEVVVLVGTTPRLLAKTGINATSVIVRGEDGVAYPPSSYSLTAAAGADGNIATTGDNTLSLARNGAGIPEDVPVFISYEFTDNDYFTPRRFEDFDDVKTVYGEALDPNTGEILSPLSLAAKIAFQNGAGTLILLATGNPSEASRPTGWIGPFTTSALLATAYNKLRAAFDVGIVVPLPVSITGTVADPGSVPVVGSDLKTHCEAASAEGSFRTGIVGFERTTTTAPNLTAASFRSKRVMLAWPNRLHYFNGAVNQSFEVGGYYLAAAYAGVFVNQPVQIPLTKKQIRGFAGIPGPVLATMTNSLKNTYSDSGVAVTEISRDGRLVVRHGTSTDRTTIHTREISLTRARDALVNLLQDTSDRSGIIGTTIDTETPARVKGLVAGAVESAVSTGVIVAYNDLKVRLSAGEPSVVEVKFEYLPAYPLNYVLISFSINVQTGEVGLAA